MKEFKEYNEEVSEMLWGDNSLKAENEKIRVKIAELEGEVKYLRTALEERKSTNAGWRAYKALQEQTQEVLRYELMVKRNMPKIYDNIFKTLLRAILREIVAEWDESGFLEEMQVAIEKARSMLQ